MHSSVNLEYFDEHIFYTYPVTLQHKYIFYALLLITKKLSFSMDQHALLFQAANPFLFLYLTK